MSTAAKTDHLEEYVPLAPRTGYGVGGTARYYLETADHAELRQAVSWALSSDLPIFVLGSGTNVLVADEGLNGLTVRWLAAGISFGQEPALIHVGAGLSLSRLVAWTLDHGLVGLEWASGIPGTIGAALRGNVGAFNGEMGPSVVEAEILGLRQPCTTAIWSNREMEFAYRDSRLKREPGLVLTGWLQLRDANPRTLAAARKVAQACLQARRRPHLVSQPNCGSVFKNITDPEAMARLFQLYPDWRSRARREWGDRVPAGALIDALGLKGVGIGGACVSRDHANVIVRHGAATATDILTLVRHIQSQAEEQTGVRLEPEIQLLGFPQNSQ